MTNNRLQINKGGYVSIPHNDAYNFGKEAFSVMAYICPNKIENGKTVLTEGTICSSKPSYGAMLHGRRVKGGGWQLFLEKEGEDLMICFKTDDGYGYHLLKAPLNNLYDDKALRNSSGAAADLSRSNVLYKEYTHFVAAVRGDKGDMNLYVNGYLIARATPFSNDAASMNTESFQLKGMYKETIDRPNHFFIVKKDNNKYQVGKAKWNDDHFVQIGADFNMSTSNETSLSEADKVEQGVSSISSEIKRVIPAKNMIAANRVSLFVKPNNSSKKKLLAQFASNTGPSENVDNTLGISIGRTEQYPDPYEGFIKQVSVWKTALSQADIISYTDSKKIESDSANCVGFWRLENDYKDSSSVQNNGSPNGSLAFVYRDQVLPLYIEEQQNTNWCWAASSLSIIEFYDPMSKVLQKDIVTKYHGDERNSGGWMHNYLKDNTTLMNQSYFIKSRGDLGSGKFVTSAGKELDFAFLKDQINKGNPMGLDIQWTPSGGHAVVLSGIHPTTGKLIINDPWSGLVFIKYEDFVNGKYPTNGRWNATFTTQGKEATPTA